MERIGEIAKAKPFAIILREKDLSKDEYERLAIKVMGLCSEHKVMCILHSFIDTAIRLGARNIHLPMAALRTMTDDEKAEFNNIGASCHSVKEAIEAEGLGCTYITIGHIFATECKKGLAPRGLDLLERVCTQVSIPVYAIGGISKDNIAAVCQKGARGACLMSGPMECEDIASYFNELMA